MPIAKAAFQCVFYSMVCGMSGTIRAEDFQRVTLTSFQLNQKIHFQSKREYVVSGEIAWNPTLYLFPALALRCNFGLSVFKGTQDSDIASGGLFFPLIDTGIFLTGIYRRVFIEFGGGNQIWFDQSTNFTPKKILGGNVGWVPSALIWNTFDRAFLGYSNIIGSTENSREIRAGVGIRL